MSQTVPSGVFPIVGRKGNVLVVDDEPMICSAFAQVMHSSRPHYNVDSVSSAEEAIKLLEINHYDVMVTDYRLPQADGLTLVKYVNECYPETWTILITAYGTENTYQQAFQEGCVAYFEKPFNYEKLTQWIDLAVNRSEYTRLSSFGALDPSERSASRHLSDLKELRRKSKWYVRLREVFQYVAGGFRKRES